MKPLWRSIASALGVAACATLLVAAPVPKGTDEAVADRKTYLPQRAYQPRSGKAVGIAVSDVAKMMGREGRSSQADALGFSSNGGSYNWIYVPMDENPQITNLNVRVGEKGDDTIQFPKLGMATLKRIEPWGVKNTYTLVEVEVNNGTGAPADEAFVASKMTVLEGTKAYPLKVDDCVAKAKSLYKDYQKDNAKALDVAMAKAMKDALADKNATGPRETAELMHITWLTKEQRLVVRFQTTITDGDYKNGGGGANVDGGDAPAVAVPEKAVAKRPPPPPGDFPKVRWGTQFGIEFGRSYEFSLDGAALGTKTLAAEGFKKVLPPPPAGNIRGGPFPLPPAPLPVLPPKKEK